LQLVTAKEFHAILKSKGDRSLRPNGWRYRNQSWHLTADGKYVALIPADTKYGIGFQIKYLTVTLVHSTVTCPDGEKPKAFQKNDQFCPVQISPARLMPYVRSGYRDWIWHHVLPHRNRWTRRAAYEPLYYGGKDKQVLADNKTPHWLNRWELRTSIRSAGATLLSEEDVEETIAHIVEQVAEYAVPWAEHMTPQEVNRQLRQYGDSWHAPRWLEAYEVAYPDAQPDVDISRERSSRLLRLRHRVVGI